MAVGIGSALGAARSMSWYDSFAHATISAAMTFIAGMWLYDRALTGAVAAPMSLVATLTAVGVGVGGLWEIAEFAYDHLNGPSNVILGKPDTIADLAWDCVGALVGASAVLVTARRGHGLREGGRH